MRRHGNCPTCTLRESALNLLNGTLDLERLELRRHAATDLLTKRANVVYDPQAESPWFDKLLKDSLPDHHAAFVLRVFGYALLGDPREQIFTIFHGRGANGSRRSRRRCSGSSVITPPMSTRLRSPSDMTTRAIRISPSREALTS